MRKFLTNISGGQFIGATVGLGVLSSVIGKASPILTLAFVPLYLVLFYARSKRLNVMYLLYIYIATALAVVFVSPIFAFVNLVIFLYLTFKNVK